MLYMKKDPSAAQHLATTSVSSCQILITRLFFSENLKFQKNLKKKCSEDSGGVNHHKHTYLSNS